jgi:single-stranded DNA-binding protein
MLRAHISGRLIKPPERKTSASGKDYTIGLLAVDMGQPAEGKDNSIIVRCMAFGSDAALLATAPKGDVVTCIGNFELGIWQAEQGPRIGATLFVERLVRLGGKTPSKGSDKADNAPQGQHSGGQGYWGGNPKRKPADAPSRPPTGYESLDDDLPF